MSGMQMSEQERAESVRMIRDSAAAVAPRDGDFSRIRALRYQDPGFDRAVWREMGDLGWIGLRLPEEAGGIGLGVTEACALAEELGRGLVPEPLIAGALSAALLTAAEGVDGKILRRLLTGSVYAATAWQSAPDGLAPSSGREAARLFIPMARGAEMLLVPVREDGGLVLYAVDPAGQDVTMLGTQDGGNVGAFTPDLSGATRLEGDVGAALERALDDAALTTAAYLLGAMEEAFEMTLGYLRTRHQFDRPLGSFQALQHRAADLKIEIALTRASLEAAAIEIDEGAEDARRRAAVSRAKARAAEAAMRVTREAVQLHGAIGYTDEFDIGLFVRKAMTLANDYGSAAWHRRRFMADSPEDGA